MGLYHPGSSQENYTTRAPNTNQFLAVIIGIQNSSIIREYEKQCGLFAVSFFTTCEYDEEVRSLKWDSTSVVLGCVIVCMDTEAHEYGCYAVFTFGNF